MSSTFVILICVGVFLLIVLLCLAGYFYYQQSQAKKVQEARVQHTFEGKQENFATSDPGSVSETDVQEKAFEALRKDKTISSIPLLDKLLNKHFKQRINFIQHLIEQTGVSVKVGEFVLLTLLIGFIGALLGDLVFGIPLVGFIIVVIPYFFLNSLREKRKAKFVSQMPGACDMMNGDLRAGLDIQQVFRHIAEEQPPPISEEFQRIVAEINLGVPTDEAIIHLSERIDTVDVQMLCTGIVINRELGGNLSELVSGVAATVRERFRLKGVIKALTAESNASTWLLISMPVALFFILNLLAPDAYGAFIEEPLGQMILKGCGVSMLIGYMVIKKMADIEA